MPDYAHPEVLGFTERVAQHKGDPNVRIAQVDVDIKAYDEVPQVQDALAKKSASLVDVRSPQEFTGEILSLPDCRKPVSAADTYRARGRFRDRPRPLRRIAP